MIMLTNNENLNILSLNKYFFLVKLRLGCGYAAAIPEKYYAVLQ